MALYLTTAVLWADLPQGQNLSWQFLQCQMPKCRLGIGFVKKISERKIKTTQLHLNKCSDQVFLIKTSATMAEKHYCGMILTLNPIWLGKVYICMVQSRITFSENRINYTIKSSIGMLIYLLCLFQNKYIIKQ